jgi:hypothetical protein
MEVQVQRPLLVDLYGSLKDAFEPLDNSFHTDIIFLGKIEFFA